MPLSAADRHPVRTDHAAPERRSILIIGLGNSLRGDDGIGPATIAMLRQRRLGSHVELLDVHQLTPELAHRLAAARLAIMVDASMTDPPGVIRCGLLEALDDRSVDAPLNHSLSPRVLFEMSQHLYGQSPRVYVFTVGGRSFGCVDRFSDDVSRAMPALMERIVRLMNWWDGRVATCSDTDAETASGDRMEVYHA